MSKPYNNGQDWGQAKLMRQVRQIFNNPKPIGNLSREHNHPDDLLVKRLAARHWQDIELEDLVDYFEELAFAQPAQQELFNYLFPVCLYYWVTTLMEDKVWGNDLAEFHLALHRSQALTTLVNEKQQESIYAVFKQGLIARISAEPEVKYRTGYYSDLAWIGRFNSLGYIVPLVEPIWADWWTLDNRGKARAAIIYMSGLIYLPGENPLFAQHTPEGGGGGPYLTENDSAIFDQPWQHENLRFIKNCLNPNYIQRKLAQVAQHLDKGFESELVAKMLKDAVTNRDIVEMRIADLITGLSKSSLEADAWDA